MLLRVQTSSTSPHLIPEVATLARNMEHTAAVSADDQVLAAELLRRVLEQAESGSLAAPSSQARRLLRRLEGVLIALEVPLTPDSARADD